MGILEVIVRVDALAKAFALIMASVLMEFVTATLASLVLIVL